MSRCCGENASEEVYRALNDAMRASCPGSADEAFGARKLA